jgi:hypothetical protein
MNYIISGAGRTGGHLLKGIIESAGVESVVYTHDPELDLGDDLNTTLVILDRRDRFAALMSNAITQHTGQSTIYDNNTIEPFAVDPGHFKWHFDRYMNYYRSHDLSRLYAGVYKMYLEDFVSDHDVARHILGLPASKAKLPPLARNPAPYNFENIVTNWFELKTVYLRRRQGLE